MNQEKVQKISIYVGSQRWKETTLTGDSIIQELVNAVYQSVYR
jgi:hypothetical protein